MTFIRENILKIIILIAVIIVFSIILSSCSTSSPKTSVEKYEVMEQQLKDKAISFTSNNKRFLPKEINESSKLNMRTLVNNEMIKQYYANEDKNIACSGYVLITKKGENSYKYIPFLKCGKYYETKTLTDYIKENDEVVAANDGLYQYGDEYVYRGENPKNFLQIGDKVFRIISINADGQLRVISSKKYDSTIWDDRYNSTIGKSYGITNYEKSRIKDYLNKVYETDIEYFTSDLKSVIVPHDICVSPISSNNTDFSGVAECALVSENQNLGLLQANEYFRASVDSGCRTMNSPECENYNYMSSVNAYSMVTQTPAAENSYQVIGISSGVSRYINASSRFNIYLTFYIDANTLYQSGEGTSISPYLIR